MKKPVSRWVVLGVLFVVLVALDQWTKLLAVEHLTFAFSRAGELSFAQKVEGLYSFKHLEAISTEPYYVWRPVWRMSYAENPGAAWGLFRGLPPDVRNGFFILVSLAAVGFIVGYYRKLRDDQRYLQVALALVLAGAVGNFIDRLARRYVIDFIEWYWWNRTDLRWPTFNIADSLIVVGVALLLLHPGPGKAKAEAGVADRDAASGA